MTAMLDRVSDRETLITELNELVRTPQAERPPERTRGQCMEALDEANRIRTYRKNLKRDLKARKVTIHDLLLEPPDEIRSMKVFDLLLATPKYGRVKANHVLKLCGASASKTVGGMSPRQRTEIVSMLRR